MAHQADRVFPARPIDLIGFTLLVLGNGHKFYLILQPLFSQYIPSNIKMPLASINNQQVREYTLFIIYCETPVKTSPIIR